MALMYIDFQLESKSCNLDELNFFEEKKIVSMHRIGDISRTKLILNYSQINYHFCEGDYSDISDLFTNFISELASKEQKLFNYIEAMEISCSLSVVIKKFDEELSFTILPEHIDLFNKLHCKIDFDYYDMTS